MLDIFKNQTYARLFSAQVIALLGTGLLTVALGLLAYDLAGASAGAVLGIAYAIKMVAYVGLAPVSAALLARFPRKTVLIAADLVRAGVALCLPFIDAVWQIYILIFVLQAASATFTPAFQAVIPDVLPDEAEYTQALSLSQLAYNLESLISPVIAALLLGLLSYHALFIGTVFGFVGSAVLVRLADVPPQPPNERYFIDRLTRGIRLYLATPRLCGLLALTFSAASISAFVLVNTVVLVRAEYARSEASLAVAMAAYGLGSMVVALMLPRVLEHFEERPVMVQGALTLSLTGGFAGLYFLTFGMPAWFFLLVFWAVMGGGYSAVVTPAGRLLRQSVDQDDRAAIFNAHFALSHACWLITYPLAGWVALAEGTAVSMLLMAWLAFGGVFVARQLWPYVLHRY